MNANDIVEIKKAESELKKLIMGDADIYSYFLAKIRTTTEDSPALNEKDLFNLTKLGYLTPKIKEGKETVDAGLKLKRVVAFIVAYEKLGIKKGLFEKDVKTPAVVSFLFNFYSNGESVPETMLMNPEFIKAYKETLKSYSK